MHEKVSWIFKGTRDEEIISKIKNVINKQTRGITWNTKICCICKEKLEDKYARDKKYCKVRDHCHYLGEYRGDAQSIYNLKYSVPKEISIVFHNRSNYDYDFIIKELAEELEGQFSCLGENTEKYINF